MSKINKLSTYFGPEPMVVDRRQSDVIVKNQETGKDNVSIILLRIQY